MFHTYLYYKSPGIQSHNPHHIHGDHEEKYEGKEDADVGDEQFEINDGRSFASMYEDMEKGGLQPVLNDYIYV